MVSFYGKLISRLIRLVTSIFNFFVNNSFVIRHFFSTSCTCLRNRIEGYIISTNNGCFSVIHTFHMICIYNRLTTNSKCWTFLHLVGLQEFPLIQNDPYLHDLMGEDTISVVDLDSMKKDCSREYSCYNSGNSRWENTCYHVK